MASKAAAKKAQARAEKKQEAAELKGRKWLAVAYQHWGTAESWLGSCQIMWPQWTASSWQLSCCLSWLAQQKKKK
jgi:hypothetical protein